MGISPCPSSEVVFGTHFSTEGIATAEGVLPFHRIQGLTLDFPGSATDCGEMFGDAWPSWFLEVITGFQPGQ